MDNSPFSSDAIQSYLPDLRGKLNFKVPLNARSWFRVGGPAEVLINPADTEDLAYIIQNIPLNWPVFTLGATSNLLIRDGGIEGISLQLRRGFNDIIPDDAEGLIVGAGCLDTVVAENAVQLHLEGMEFLIGIPGSIGGAILMNAGAHGSEIASILDWVEIMTREGEIIQLPAASLGLSYRHSSLPQDAIILRARLQGKKSNPDTIRNYMDAIRKQREQTQPIRSRTGGSTFRNPDPSISQHKAWELIDMVGGRGLSIGGAQVSQKHCNFLINTGNATASDIENLGEELRRRVFESFGIKLIWEIKRVGRNLVEKG